MDFDKLFLPLEAARCQFESVWNSVNVLHLTTDSLDDDRFIILHKRAMRAFDTRYSSKSVHKTLKAMEEEDRARNHLSQNQRTILKRYLVEYKHQGFELEEEKFMTLTYNWTKKFRENCVEYAWRIQVRPNFSELFTAVFYFQKYIF